MSLLCRKIEENKPAHPERNHNWKIHLMKPKNTLRYFLALAGSSLLAISSASADTLFWSANGTTQGGAGTWDTSTARWGTVAAGPYATTWDNTTNANDTAVFGSTAGVVALGTPITVGGLTFNTTGYSITGSTLTLAGASAPVISAGTSITATISSDIAGTNGLEKTGAGTVILSGTNNTYSGTTTISAGTLEGRKSTTGGASPFGTSTIQLNAGTLTTTAVTADDTTQTYNFGNDVNVGGSATIGLSRTGTAGSNKTQAYGNLSIGNSTLTVSSGNINHTLSFTGAILTGNAIINNSTNATTNIGAISETGGSRNLTKQGGATLRLLGTNTYTGTTTISGGTLEVQGSIASSSGIINNATLTFNSNSAQSYGNVISGSGSLTKSGSGTTILTADNSFLGSVTINAGTLSLLGLNQYTGTTSIGNPNTLGAGTAIINTLKNYGVASSLGAPTSGDIIFGKYAVNNLIYVGSGNTTNRTIRHEADVSNRNNGSGIYNNGTGALIFNGSTFNTPFVASGNAGRTTVFNLGGTYTGDANEIRGVIANNDGTSFISIAKFGSGTWSLGGSNTYTGTTTLNAGTLKLNYDTGSNGTNTSKLADINGILALNGGTLELSGGSHTETVLSTTLNNGTTFIKQTGGSSTLSMGVITYTGGALDFSAAGIANVSTSAVTNGILSSAAGTARVTVGGADWATKDGSNNVIAYTGYTDFDGTASAANINYRTVGNATLTANRGATSNTFKITTSGTGESMKLNNNFNLTLGSLLFAGADNYTIAAESGTGRINSAFLLHNYGAGTLTLGATNGAITQFGTGKTILNGNNASNVGINIFGGTVQFSNNLQIGTNTGVQAIALNNGTLLADTTSADIALNNGGLNSRTVTLGAGGGTLDVIGGGKLTVSGVISDTAGQFPTLTIGSASSNGTIEFTAANTYTGQTRIAGGKLYVNNTTGSGTGTGAVTVGTSGTLGGNGTISGAVTVNGGALKPGNSTGLLTVGSLVLNASSSTTLEINGTDRGVISNGYDALGVNTGGSIDLGGALIFEFGNLAAFANGTDFDLFSFDTTSTGDFSGVTSTGFYAGTWGKTGEIWSLDSGGQTLSFSEVTGNLTLNSIPEPGTALLGSIGLLALLRRRR